MNRRRNQSENEAQASPYRMGNWTVTMLKDELRVRQLPTSGKKAELLDRLETVTASPKSPSKRSNLSPQSRPRSMMVEKQIETSATKQKSTISFSPRSLTRSLQEKLASGSSPSKSPAKSLLSGLAEVGNPFMESPSRRGRSHVRNTLSSSSQMMTRSRSRSMSRGTFLQWTRAPHTILANFFMSAVEESTKQVSSRPVWFLTAFALVAVCWSLAFFNQTSQHFAFAVQALTPFWTLFASGLKEAFGFGSFNASLVQFAASSVSLLRSFGVKGLKKQHALQSNQSASFWAAIGCHAAAYTAGSLAGSYALYWLASKCRHNTFFITNARFRSWLNFAAKQFYLTAMLPNFVFGLDVAGLVAGFAGFSEVRFWKGLFIGRALIGIPARLAYGANASIVEMVSMRVNAFAPFLKSHINNAVYSVQFVRQSTWFTRFSQYAHWIVLAYLAASAIKAIANTRAYNRFRRNRL